MKAQPDRAPNCWGCQHFMVTHQPATPYGCRLMGFRSRMMPCLEVLRADGHPCQGYTPKLAVSISRQVEMRH